MIEKRSRPYEILVRYGEDGITGAHTQTIEEIVEDGNVISSMLGDPVPVELSAELVQALNALVS
jgi:hypothetical protein